MYLHEKSECGFELFATSENIIWYFNSLLTTVGVLCVPYNGGMKGQARDSKIT